MTDNLDNILDLTDPRTGSRSKGQNIEKIKPHEKTKFQQPENIGISQEEDDYEEEDEEEEEETESFNRIRQKRKTSPQQADIILPSSKGNKRKSNIKSVKNEKEVRLMDSETRPKKSMKKSFSGHGAPSSETNDRTHPYPKSVSHLPRIPEEKNESGQRRNKKRGSLKKMQSSKSVSK